MTGGRKHRRPYHLRLWTLRDGTATLGPVKSSHHTPDVARRVGRLYRDTQAAVVGWRVEHAPTGTLHHEEGAP